jgi:hypothetical protein
MNKTLPWLIPLFLLFGGLIIFSFTTPADSALASNVVISEVQIASVSSSNDEFIELYNPTLSVINLNGWQLTRKPQDGDPETSLIASLSGAIAPHGFFLIAKNNSFASPSADLLYSSSIADNNTISIYSDQRITLVDKLGFGTASDFEGNPASTLSADQSLERRANSSSTAISMGTGGVDEFEGNGEDTGNNASDFILRATPQPQNSSSTPEPAIVPTPTPTGVPSPTPTLTPTSTPTPTPTDVPTPTPTSTPTPTQEPSPTPSSTVSPTPSLSPTPTGTPSSFISLRVSCTVTLREVDFGFFKFRIPLWSCRLIRV